VLPEFLPERSDPEEARYFWAYTIEITNMGRLPVQLIARHWTITDGVGKVETVRGLGVVGEQPMLNPGDTFRYTSGCPLSTPSGLMVGTYRMTDADGRHFEIEIPAFSLDSPHARRVLN
jgi:ApaG protein